jgi:rSAM/selenodomain-associated transferase 1
MAKAPVAGAVKTRLAREVGAAQATRFARASTAALLDRIGHDPRWQTILAVTPDTSVASHCWPRGPARMPQGAGDLGRRMQRVFDLLPPGPAVIIGTDVPGIARADIARAFRLLGRHDAVFGPAADGGYWLVGARRRPTVPRLFANVRWSSPHALADTLANLQGRPVTFVATLGDVDEAKDLGENAARFGRRVLPIGGESPPLAIVAPPTPNPSPQRGGE